MVSVFNKLTTELNKHTYKMTLQVSQEGMKINSSWYGSVWEQVLGKHKTGDGT